MPPPTPLSVSSFATTQLSLLDAELQSELLETSTLISATSPTALQRAGVAITNLTISSQRTGLGGKTVVELVLDSAISGGAGKDGTGALPEHGIRVGDIVLVAEQPAGSARKREVKELEGKGARGVVTRAGRDGVSVALDLEREEGLEGGKRLWVVKLANDVTYKRMNQVMTRLLKMGEGEYSGFLRVMFGLSSVVDLPEVMGEETGEMEWVDENLNESQKEAIRFALASKEVALIHGPPGVSSLFVQNVGWARFSC